MQKVRPAREWATNAATIVLAAGVFLFSWLFRFNDPNGSFAGLTDDHFFYLVRGWQILFGDLPVRDFVDHGAPLYYYVGALVQLFGRGTLSELVFSVTAIAAGATLTFLLASRASGSLVFGLVGSAFQVWLEPRFYNYPKILAYAVALPVMWRYADAPTPRRLVPVAIATVIGFLFRHDHGAFIGLAMGVLLLTMTQVSWRERIQHGLVYGALCVVLVLPYLVFIQVNGGVGAYFRQASAWAERDRDRAPVVWPGVLDNPDGVSDAARSGTAVARAIGTIRDNRTAWIFYAEIAIPLVALALLLLSPDGYRPAWPQARAKLVSLIALGLVLDAGFLRSPLEARLADPSVPLAILVAWMLTAIVALVVGRVHGSGRAPGWGLRVGGVALAMPVLAVCALTLSGDWYRRLDKAGMTERWGKVFERVGIVADQVRTDWQLETWADRSEQQPDLMDLALYLNACTRPTDRVLLQAYTPQVLALSRRAFAGGHADLRPGFFGTTEAQELTIARLRRQSVPVILLETGESYRNFRAGFPLVTAYLDATYRVAGTREADRYGATLLVRTDLQPTGIWAPLDWPCYGSGRLGV